MSNTHKTWFGKKIVHPIEEIFDSVSGWFKKAWKDADENVIEFVIHAVNEVKDGLLKGVLPVIAGATATKKDDELLQIANDNLDKVLIDAVALQAITKDTSVEDLKVLATKIAADFGANPDSKDGQLYTSIGARLYILYIKVKYAKDIPYGEAAALIEGGWQEFKKNRN